MNKNKLTSLYKAEIITEIDFRFAKFIAGLTENDEPDVLLGAALASNAAGSGDVCLDLSAFEKKELLDREKINKLQLEQVVCPLLSEWKEKLFSVSAVGKPGDFCPLILDGSRLYLYRYWEYEKELSDSIKKRAQYDLSENILNHINLPLLREAIKRLFPENRKSAGISRQLSASLICLLKRFCVVSGGPGTGKTTIIGKMLALLLELNKDKNLKILLAAPTGKAAARLAESIKNVKEKIECEDVIKNAIPAEASTIHRMLKTVAGSPYFRHDSNNPLHADIVIVDEASMVDLALMAKLVRAIPENACLILVGDKDQLASVESGSVLGDICSFDHIDSFSQNFGNTLSLLTGYTFLPQASEPSDNKSKVSCLSDCIIDLKENFRFKNSSGIAELSSAVNSGDSARALSSLRSKRGVFFEEIINSKDLVNLLSELVIKGYSDYLSTDDPKKAIFLINKFKILCAVKKGPFGVETVNRLVEQILFRKGLITLENRSYYPWYRGRPVLITKNDYNLGLYNGDIGVIMAVPGSKNDDLYAFFQQASGEMKYFLPQQLPEHETAFAMTVHKSQGSEFDEVILILPERDYPLLTKELVYTGITRAKKKVSVWGRENIIKDSISRSIKRTSGLGNALWGLEN